MKINEKSIKSLIKMEGEVRGATLQTDVDYVLLKKGKEGLNLLEAEMKRIGYPIDYNNINKMGWYPLGLRLVSFFEIINVFDMDEEEIKVMGNNAPKVSALVKIALQFFVNLQKFADKAASFWQEHYTVGLLEVKEASGKTGVFKFHLSGFYSRLKVIDEHLAWLYVEIFLAAYFTKITLLAMPGAKCEMKKINIKNEECYEFIAITKKN